MKLIILTRLALALALCAAVLGATNAVAQTPPPISPTLPANAIGTAALISPSDAAGFYGTSLTSTDELATVTGVNPTPTPPEIIEMSRALKGNVDLIYQYVRNNIQVSWMYGLQKGALGTLIDKAGTPFDQVDLMVKLLRQAGYTANYVSGTITLTPAQFTAWTGITSANANAACQLLANGGIPASINGSSSTACTSVTGAISTVTMSHIWVQAAISGSACGSNCLFDPSYKPYAKISGINLATATGLSTGAPLTAAITWPGGGPQYTTGTFSGGVPWVNNLNSASLNTLVQGYAQSLLTYMYGNNLQAAQMEDIVGGGVIVPDTPPAGGWRQTTLPYTTSVAFTWTGGIPDLYRTTLALSGIMWDWQNPSGTQPPPPGAWDNMFPTIVHPFFVDQIYGRALTIDTDYGVGMNQNGHSQFANVVTLSLDGMALATYTDPQVGSGTINNYGAELIYTSRGAPAYVTLTANHPYAASAGGAPTIGGTYMDTTVTRQVQLVTPLTIVDGFGDTGPGLFTKWSDEKAGDNFTAWATYICPSGSDFGICGNKYPGGTGNFERQKMTANWLGQYVRAAHLHAAIAGSIAQLHHELGFVYGDNYLNPGYPTAQSQNTEMPVYSIGDNFNRLDVDSGISLESRTADPVARRAAIQAISASSSTLEGSVGQQMDGLPDSSSTATRFDWGNAPPGTAGNWDAPTCGSHNAYEDPACAGPRSFVQFTSSNYSQATNVALVEAHPASFYTTDPLMTPHQQPLMGMAQAAMWNSAYSAEIAAYADCGSNCGNPTNIPFTVTTSQETFLGPGQRAGAYNFWTGSGHCAQDACQNYPVVVGYYDALSRQRGPAFVATVYDSNGDPLEIAHDLVALDTVIGPPYGGTLVLTKGGGGGSQPDQQEKYNPADAADVLKARFVDKSNAMGVNLSNGSIGYTAPAKLDEGNGGFPYELSAEFQWHPMPFPTASPPMPPIAPRPGWTTNWNNNLALSGSGLEAMGKSDVRAAVGTIAAFMAEQDIYKSTPSIQRDVAAVLTQAWWARQINNDVATASLGTSSRQFVSLPQGVTVPVTGANWISTGGSYATLSMTNAPVAYEQICPYTIGSVPTEPYAPSRGWDYTGSTNSLPVSFTITNANGDQQNYTSWSNYYSTNQYANCGFAEGMRLWTWTFPQGVTIHLDYGTPWNPGLGGGLGGGFDQLMDVYNTFGTSSTHARTITFTSDSNADITGFSATDGHSVSLGLGTGFIANSVTDAMGAVTTFSFSGPQPTSATQRPIPYQALFQIFTPDKPAAPNTEYLYDSIGHVKEVADAENLQVGDRAPWTFFIAEGARGERDDPLNDAWSVTYDVYGHPASYQDEDGNVTQASADGRGRITQYIYPEGDCEVFGFDDRNNTTSIAKVDKTSACNTGAGSTHVLTASVVWDPTWNKPTQVTDFDTNVTTLAYYPSGNGASELETATRAAVGGVHPVYNFTYDAAGKLLTATDPVISGTNITTSNSYSTDGLENLLTTQVDPSGLDLTSSFVTDPTGNVSSTADPRSNVTEFLYDLDRRKTESHHHDGNIAAALNAASRSQYDVLGRDFEDDAGTVFSGTTITTWTMTKQTTYTPTSKVASVTDADSRVTTTTYDPADRTSIVTDPVLRQSSFAYDAAGNVMTEFRAWGTQIAQAYATYTYATGTSCPVCTPNGGDGEKLSVYDADGSSHITTYAYDGFNRPNKTIFPDGSTEKIQKNDGTSGYDANGNVLSHENRADQFLTYTYDALNRMATKVIPAYGSTPANTIAYAYDLGGRRTNYSDTPGDNIALNDDTAGRLTSTVTTILGLTGTKTATYTLDANGNRTELLWPDGYYVGYCYDSLNRMTVAMANSTSSGCATNVLASYAYNPLSQRTALTYGSSASMTYVSTTAGDLTSLTLAMAATVNDNAWTLQYSNAHQLASEGASIARYKWQTPTSAATDAYATVNTLNQYPTVTPNGKSAQTQGYDGNGNLMNDGTVGFTYDPENRLMTATNGSVLQAVYAYDPLGRRQEKSGTGVTTTYFVNDGSDDIAEYNSSAALTRRFVPGPAIDESIALVPASGTTELLYTDHHGSTVATSDSSGNLVEGPFVYDAYGNCHSGTVQTNPCPTTAASIPFRFTGQYFDTETGCYYYRARMYCADSLHGGRFLQTDPVGYKDDLNLYSYVGNDPTDRVDPTGEAGCPNNQACPPSSSSQGPLQQRAGNSQSAQLSRAVNTLVTGKANSVTTSISTKAGSVGVAIDKQGGNGVSAKVSTPVGEIDATGKISSAPGQVTVSNVSVTAPGMLNPITVKSAPTTVVIANGKNGGLTVTINKPFTASLPVGKPIVDVAPGTYVVP